MSDLLPHQIVYLQKGSRRLYAETIQIVTERQLCWARPLALVTAPEAVEPGLACEEFNAPDPDSVDVLVDGPDILWPLDQFYPALDTEVIPILALLQDSKEVSERSHSHIKLQQFIREFWQG